MGWILERLCNIHDIGLGDTSSASIESSVSPKSVLSDAGIYSASAVCSSACLALCWSDSWISCGCGLFRGG